jgi:hypothetical protein
MVLIQSGAIRAEIIEAKNDQCELRLQIERAAVEARANTKGDHVFVFTRLACNTTGIAYALNIFSGVPMEVALPVGLVGGLMSAAQQLFHAQLTYWQTHRGLVVASKDKKASLFEAFVVKEYALHALYLGVLQAAQAALGIKPSWINLQVFQTAFLSLISEGFLNLSNVKATDNLVTKYKKELVELSEQRTLTPEDFDHFYKKARRIWTFSKAAAVGISFGATVLALLDMDGIIWAAPSLQILGVGGALSSLYLFKDDIKRKLCSMTLLRLKFK